MVIQGNDKNSTALIPMLVLMIVILMADYHTHAADFYLPAADSRGHHTTVTRSNSSTGVVVRLGATESIQLTFCLRQTTVIQVLDVLYSNDGSNETVAAVVDDRFLLGTFTSRAQSNWGSLWNVFLRSFALPNSLALLPGWHSLRVGVLVPSDGIELDSVHVWFSDEGLTREILNCSLLCTTSLPVVPPNTAHLWQLASAKQTSYPTRCAEEDNVKVPLYLVGVSEYTVTASMPTYASFANRRESNTMDCTFLSPVLFTFQHLPLTQNQTFSRLAKGVSLFGHISPGGSEQMLRVEFLLQGRSTGHVDAEIGSELTIHFENNSGSILIRCAYLGRTGQLAEMHSTVSPGASQHKLHFPDYTWRENASNIVQLDLQSVLPFSVTAINLQRRPMRGDTIRTVNGSDSVIVEAVEVDFWWRRPETMELKNGETGETWGQVDYFRISVPVPWNGGFAQVLVMYQDGNVRLAPLPPPHVDWIPFGSSVIIGPSDPDDLRPSAPITSVTFYPSNFTLQVFYQNGGSVKLELNYTRNLTQISVKDYQFDNRDLWQMPFVTLRSMYLEDGNSDCDSLLVDGKNYQSIMDSWGTLKGKSFFFFRRCESKHLTLSPDIRIDVKRASHVSGVGQTSNDFWWKLY